MFIIRTFRSAQLFFLADDEHLAAGPAERFTHAWVGIWCVSFLWALAAFGLWKLTRKLFGTREETHFLSGMIIAAIMLLLVYRRSARGVVKLLAGADPVNQALLAAMLAVGLTVCLSVLRTDWHRQEMILWDWLAWIRPACKAGRILLLLPMWGAWAMFILPHFRRVDAEASPAAAVMARGCGPLTATVLMAVLLVWSIWYFAYLPWTQLSIFGVAILAAVGGGLYLAGRKGKMDREVLLATNLLTQLAMLLAFLANRELRFW
ncbi:MAG: hypothetical protein K8S55_09650 [Phycisphaerae bacterium]|nr:hypothetical protein [Phycisphaerae bacterium]